MARDICVEVPRGGGGKGVKRSRKKKGGLEKRLAEDRRCIHWMLKKEKIIKRSFKVKKQEESLWIDMIKNSYDMNDILLSHVFRPKPTPLKKLSLDGEIYRAENLIHVSFEEGNLDHAVVLRMALRTCVSH